MYSNQIAGVCHMVNNS